MKMEKEKEGKIWELNNTYTIVSGIFFLMRTE